MYVYWEPIVEPLLAALAPRSIVEIGAGSGQTTRRLLAFCQRHGGVVHSIDPAPGFDARDWQRRYGERFVFHGSRSLEALPGIAEHDAVLIDGDHNWYTVFQELKLIESASAKGGRPFPLVFLHDVAWPYGRRDLYYDPAAIPVAYRHRCRRGGIRFGAAELQARGGLNSQLVHALAENTPRNGVLTAVEDFLGEAAEALELILVPGFHGLGLLFPSQVRARNPSLARMLDSWAMPTALRVYIESLEAARNVAASALVRPAARA